MFNELFSKAAGVFQSAHESVATKSAMNSLLWIMGPWLFFVFAMTALLAWIDLKDYIPLLIFSSVVLLGFCLFAYFFLLFFDRNRLHSDKYNIERKRLHLMGQHVNGLAEDALPAIAATSDEPTSNAYADMITSEIKVDTQTDAEVRHD